MPTNAQAAADKKALAAVATLETLSIIGAVPWPPAEWAGAVARPHPSKNRTCEFPSIRLKHF